MSKIADVSLKMITTRSNNLPNPKLTAPLLHASSVPHDHCLVNAYADALTRLTRLALPAGSWASNCTSRMLGGAVWELQLADRAFESERLVHSKQFSVYIACSAFADSQSLGLLPPPCIYPCSW